MNEETPQYQSARHRSHSRSKLLNKVYRFRALLQKKWWIPVAGVVLGAIVAAAFSIFGPPSFTSIGRMIVSIKLAIPEGSVYSEEMSSFLGTQSALMQSGVVMTRARTRVAAEHPDMAPQQVMLRVSVVPRTSIFILQGTCEDRNYAEVFLQACMEEYIQVKKEMRSQTSDTTVAGLTEQVLRLEKELRLSDQDLVDFQSTNSVMLFEDQGNSAANYLSALNQRLAALKSEHDLLATLTPDQNLERKQTSSDTNLPVASAVGPASGDPLSDEYQKAKQEIMLLQADQQDLAQYLRPKHPKMIAMSEEISRRQKLLDIFRQQSTEQLIARKGSLELQMQNMEKDVKEWDAKALDVSRVSAEFHTLKANSDRIRALYERLLATMQTLDVNKEISPESVTIMEKASPAFPDRPKLSRQLLTGTLVGLGLSFAVLLVLERLDDRMSSFSELQEMFDEEIMGQIPRERGRTAPALIGSDDERHAFVEAYRNLRSSLLYMNREGKNIKTLLITSSVPNDGKSMTSANFAITLASSGSKVLLVDADLRKGALHHRFEVKSEPGLCEVLSEGFNWQEATQPTHIKSLSILPRGRPTPHSSELFINKITEEFLKNAAENYDYVVIDTAPVMAADDVSSLAPQVQGVIFVVRAEETSARIVRAALDLLYQRQVNVLGLVFNAVHPRSGDYYYYYKYEDYYRAYPAGGDNPRKGHRTGSSAR